MKPLLKKFSSKVEERLTGRHKYSFKFCGKIKNKKILDVGCSYGWFEKAALKSGCREVIGIDTDEGSLLNAKNQIRDKKVKFIKSSATDLSMFKRNYFDKAVMWEVLEHIPKWTEEKAFREINRVLRPNGKLYLSVPNRNFWSCILDPAWWLIGHRHYSLIQIEKIAKKTGFKIEKVNYGGGFYELISMIFLYIFKWIFNSEMPFKDWFDHKREMEYFGYKRGFVTLFIALKK